MKKMPKIYPVLLEEKCPNCGSPLVMRNGRFGEFAACSAFPKCRYIKKKEPEPVVDTNVECPVCHKGTLVERISKKVVQKDKSFMLVADIQIAKQHIQICPQKKL